MMTGAKLIEVTCYGDPVPQGSKRIGRAGRGGRPILIDDNADALQVWRDAVYWEVERAMRETSIHRPRPWVDGPVFMSATFYFSRPKKHYNARGELKPKAPLFKTTKPDLDKLERAICDSISDAQFWKDDSRAVMMHGLKVYDETPRVEFALYDVGGDL